MDQADFALVALLRWIALLPWALAFDIIGKPLPARHGGLVFLAAAFLLAVGSLSWTAADAVLR